MKKEKEVLNQSVSSIKGCVGELLVDGDSSGADLVTLGVERDVLKEL